MPWEKKGEEQSLMATEADRSDGKSPRRGLCPARYVFAILGCIGFINVYAMRVNLSVAMVAMVNSTGLPKENKSSECLADLNHNDTDDSESTGEFLWNEKLQGVILGSFFWGYFFTQLPGGIMAERFSGKWLLGLGVLCTAIFTLLTPVAARAGVGYLIAVRVLEGLGEGVTFPAMHAMISNWAPLNERSRLVTVIYSGSLIGTVIGLPISSYLCQYGFAGGWPSVFYVFGICGVVWFIFWAIFAYDNPDKHPWIHPDEKSYIKKGRGFSEANKVPPIPWRKLVTSLPLWAIVVAHFGQNWGFYTLLTELPTYLSTILHFNMNDSGIYSALPYLVCWIFSVVISAICDKLIEKNKLSTRNARKTFNSIGLLIPAVLLVALTFAGCDQMLTYAILVIAMMINGSIYAGYQSNHIDIASNFAGTLMGITNSIAAIPGVIGPLVVGALTEGRPYQKQWAIVFYITAGVYVFAALFYIIFGRGEEQSWNRHRDDSIISDDKTEIDKKKFDVQA